MTDRLDHHECGCQSQRDPVLWGPIMVRAEVSSSTGAAEPSIDAAVYGRRWWILAVLCLSLLIVGIDGTIVNVALPSLVRELGASSSQLQWIVDAYTLVFASFLLVAGSSGDRYGRKPALIVGLGRVRRRIVGVRTRGYGRRPDLHPCDPGLRCRVHHAVDAVDPHERVSRLPNEAARSASGRASPVSAWRSVRLPAAISSSTSGGDRSSS